MKALSLMLLMAVPFAAFAEGSISTDRPDLTEGATVIPRGSIQLETGILMSNTDEDRIETKFLQTPTLVRFGVAERLEARFETAGYGDVTIDRVAGETSSSGMQPYAIGAKLALMEGDVGGGGYAFSALFHVGIPSGADEFEREDTDYTLKAIGEVDLSDNIGLGVNIGANMAKDAADDWSYTGLATAALAIGVTHSMSAFGEIAISAPDVDGVDAGVLVDGGVTWLLTPSFQLDASVGAGVAGDDVPDFFFGAGLSVR